MILKNLLLLALYGRAFGFAGWDGLEILARRQGLDRRTVLAAHGTRGFRRFVLPGMLTTGPLVFSLWVAPQMGSSRFADYVLGSFVASILMFVPFVIAYLTYHSAAKIPDLNGRFVLETRALEFGRGLRILHRYAPSQLRALCREVDLTSIVGAAIRQVEAQEIQTEATCDTADRCGAISPALRRLVRRQARLHRRVQGVRLALAAYNLRQLPEARPEGSCLLAAA